MDTRHTKIVSTLGPASQNMVAELVAAGVSIVRINCSHLSTDEVAASVRSARSQSSKVRNYDSSTASMPRATR
jgi:pyruvate kinase